MVSEWDDDDESCVENGGLCGVQPGVKVRVYQELVDLIKQHYAPRALQYWKYEFSLPKEGTEKVAMFPFYFDFNWSHFVESDPLSVDLKHFIFNFDQEVIEKRLNQQDR